MAASSIRWDLVLGSPFCAFKVSQMVPGVECGSLLVIE
jgi:hypothetical protein